jgi:hypothetical protein
MSEVVTMGHSYPGRDQCTVGGTGRDPPQPPPTFPFAPTGMCHAPSSGRALDDTDLAMTFGARSRIAPTCVHGNTLGACLDCHREKNGWDPVTGGAVDSAGPATSHPGRIVLRESGQNYFISTIRHDDPGHWTICKERRCGEPAFPPPRPPPKSGPTT